MLVTLDDMKTFLGIPLVDITHDAFLTGQINLMSETIEAYCGRKFIRATYTQTFEADDFSIANKQFLYTFHFPLQTITEIKEVEILSDGSTEEDVLTAQEYRAHFPSGKLQRTTDTNRNYFWFQEYGRGSQVVIQYEAGYDEAPLPIQDVVFNLVAERFNKQQADVPLDFGNNVQRVAIPGVMSIDFDYTLQANERSQKFGMIIGNYANVLDSYRSERVVIGKIEDGYVS